MAIGPHWPDPAKKIFQFPHRRGPTLPSAKPSVQLQSGMPVIATAESRPGVSRWNQPFAEAPCLRYRTHRHSVPSVHNVGARRERHVLRGDAIIAAGVAKRADNSRWSWRIRRPKFPPVDPEFDRLAAIRVPLHNCDLISRGSELIIGPMKVSFPSRSGT
jgi:hypothetical protein